MDPPWTCNPLATAHNALGAINEKLEVVARDLCRVLCAGQRHFESRRREYMALSELRDLYGRECNGTCDHESLAQSAWWRRVTGDGPVGALDAMRAAVEGFRASREILEDTQRALRVEIDSLSRRSLRPLSLPSLPDELLLAIFEYVEGFDFDPSSRATPMGPATVRNHEDDEPPPMYYCGRTSVPDIKNIRLVCRRFSALAARLLVRLVRVYPTPSSISRLEAISRHPTISRGVRSVLVVLQFHPPEYIDFSTFVTMHADTLLEHQTRFETASQLYQGPPLFGEDAPEVIERAKKAYSVLNLLADEFEDESDDDSSEGRAARKRRLKVDEVHRPRLQKVHQEFCRALKEADHLVESGAFAESLGAALARLPGPLELGFGDADFVRPRELMVAYGVDIWDALRRHMLQPITGLENTQRDLDSIGYNFVPGVIAAVVQAGAKPCALRLDMTALWDPADLSPSPEAFKAIASGMPLLREFSFSYIEYAAYEGVRNEIRTGNLNMFLRPCLNIPNLCRITVDLGLFNLNDPVLDVGEILGTGARPCLTDISLRGFIVRLPYLVDLFRGLPERLDRLHLEGICLQDGTWREALDVLRTKTYGVVHLTSLLGGECDDMEPDVYEAAFGLWGPIGREISLATVYIMSDDPGEANPLQALQDSMGQ